MGPALSSKTRWMPRSIWAQEGDGALRSIVFRACGQASTRENTGSQEPSPAPRRFQLLKLSQGPLLLQNVACGQGSAARRTVTPQEPAGNSREGAVLTALPTGLGLGPILSPPPRLSRVFPVSSGSWQLAAQSQAQAAAGLVSHPPCSGAPISGHFYGLPFSTTLERQAK